VVSSLVDYVQCEIEQTRVVREALALNNLSTDDVLDIHPDEASFEILFMFTVNSDS
jgi:hypothetical protein